MNGILRKTQFLPNTKDIYGFDIETANNNKDFVLASIVGNGIKELFYDKRSFISFLKQKRFRGSIISASNLQFDFFGMMYNEPEIRDFNYLFRNSELIYAKTYLYDQKFNKKNKKGKKVTSFIDTMNYVKLSVSQLGDILGLPKLQRPDFIGKHPQTKEEWKELEQYNIRDSEISMKAIRFFYDTFELMGASPKLTIASTSMSLFKNKYVDDQFYVHDIPILLEQFEGYYGGNTHAYARGYIENYNYYDINSLYPSVMLNEYPDPNSLHITRKGDIGYIENCMGVSDVTIYCPYMRYPLLPYRTETKLLFPTGTFRGWYSHAELCRAIDLGYVIKDIHKTYYYTKECIPFREFVTDMYKKRLAFLETENNMQLVVKLLMNGLYGKFGQKFTNKDEWKIFDQTYEELLQYDSFERIGDFIRIKKDMGIPSSFCFPIWALYTTAYARLKLHDYILRSDPIYVDTDSIVTKKSFPNSAQLGKLKLEYKIKSGIIVKPKFYCFNGKSKIKGIMKRFDESEFKSLLDNPYHLYQKFTKFKESQRRSLTPNQIIATKKFLTLNDDKRVWKGDYSYSDIEFSEPIDMDTIQKTEILNTLTV